MHNFPENHIDYGMEHVVYLMVKKGNKGNREPVSVEHLQLEQVSLSRVILLEAYLEAWRQPSHVCGVIRDKIRERCMEEYRRGGEESGGLKLPPDARQGHRQETAGGMGLRDMHRCFPDYQVWDRSFQRYLQRHQLTGEWLRVWRVPVWDGWGVSEQLAMLMKWAEGWQKLSQILVLGYDPGLLAWLPELARRSRGIHFYLDYAPRDMEEIQDWIYEEYGLMTKWQMLEGGTETEAVRRKEAYPGLSQYLRSYPGPCLVIDLTGTADISVTGLKPGSMWWDLGAMEEKRHLLEDRPLGTQYFSLQTLWRDMPGITGT
ncbi:MAG: hypothetical protein J6B43_08180 [Lachnospiraceae bacterium]|nr:hypothetical protein [Lachnospiraceae bacterium]